MTNLTDAAFKSVAAGDYRPRCRGALFNAGDNERYASSATSALDLDGNPRIQGKIIDIGCWEMQAGLGFQIIVR